MIAHLRGTLTDRTDQGCVLDVGGVGYEVSLSPVAAVNLPPLGEEIRLLIVESTAMYGGGTTLYGFLTVEEKNIFNVLRENVPGTGAKKAMEMLDKAAKSFGDFRQSILDKNPKALVTLFGFTLKTAEKLTTALQGKMDDLVVSSSGSPKNLSSAYEEAVAGLISLGYREAAARQAAQSARDVLGPGVASHAVLREALRHLSGRD